MARTFLDASDSLTVSNSNSYVYGLSGTEAVTIGSGVTGIYIDQLIEKVLFSGTSSNYKFAQAGNNIKVYDSTGHTLLATTLVQGDADGTSLTFSNGTYQTILSDGVMKLGGSVVGATAAMVTPGETSAIFTLTADGSTVIEGDSGSKNLTITLTLNQAPSEAITVNYQTLTTGTATANDDFGPAAGIVNFAAGQTVATVSITVIGDALVESNETVNVKFFGAKLAADVTVIGTIINNDVDTSTTTTQPQTFTLTTGPDTIIGGVGNDTISGLSQTTASTSTDGDTLTAADVINGGGGTDVLNITTNGANADVTDGSAIMNIETVNIRASATGTSTLNAANISGLTAVNADRGAGAVTVTGLATGASIGVIGNGAVLNGPTTYAYASASGDQIINISGGTTGGNISSSNGTPAKVTINSSGANNIVGTVNPATGMQVTTLTINAMTGLTATLNAAYAPTSALTITGAGDVMLTDMSTARFKTINASGASGAVNVGDIGTVATNYAGSASVDTVTLNTAITTATFGAGNDTVTTGAVATTTAAAISGGDGTDTLVVAAAGQVDTATKRAVYANFETLNNAASSPIAADGYAGITALVTSTANGGFIGMSAAQAAAVTVTTDQVGVNYALATSTNTNDTLGLTLKNATATSSADLALSSIAGFEILNVTSLSGNVDESSPAANIVSFTAAPSLNTINLAGAYAVVLNLTNIANAVTVNNTLSGTAALSVAGEAIKGSSITGTVNGDTIATALAAVSGGSGDYVTYIAGAGDDALSTSLIALNNTNPATASLKIDGGSGVDALSFGVADATFVDNNFQYVTGVEKLTLLSTGNTSFATGGFFENNFKSSGVIITAASIADNSTAAISLSSFTGNATLNLTTAGVGNTTADNIGVTTGSGADMVTVAASSWVGAVGTAGALTVVTGIGTDTLSVTTGTLSAVTGTNAVTINPGTGADTITASHVNAAVDSFGNFTYAIADGDSLAASRDKITGFRLGSATSIADTLDLQASPSVPANTIGTNGVDSGTIKSHAITSGVITFDDVDAFATAVVVNGVNLSDALAYLAANITAANDTVAFAYDSDSNGTSDATLVFQQGTSDTVVELVGVLGTSISATNALTVGLIDLN